MSALVMSYVSLPYKDAQGAETTKHLFGKILGCMKIVTLLLCHEVYVTKYMCSGLMVSAYFLWLLRLCHQIFRHIY